MKWGDYLARGIPNAVISTPTTNINHESGLSPTVCDDRRDTILKLVQDYFHQEGASIFSSKIAVGYLQVLSYFHPLHYISYPCP
jgi:hypothetical protein